MMALYSNRNLLMPIDICGVGPRKLRAYTDDHGVALTIFYGTSCWNFVDFWNYVHFVGEAPQAIKSISEMWITPSQFEDETFYQRFLELIRRRVSGSEHQNRIRLISYDQTEDQLQELTKRICTDLKWGNLYPANPILRAKGELNTFQVRPVITFLSRNQPQNKQVSGESVFLELMPEMGTPDNRDEKWITELSVEAPELESYFANKTPWWNLPRNLELARLFVPESPCRIGRDRSISVEVSKRPSRITSKWSGWFFRPALTRTAWKPIRATGGRWVLLFRR